VAVNAYTSSFSSSAICHASRSSYRLTPGTPVSFQTACRPSNAERRTRTTNNEPRTSNDGSHGDP
jgi:hypothetical protein